jgi:uncharacterized phage infection (PIP) family protein YhgE
MHTGKHVSTILAVLVVVLLATGTAQAQGIGTNPKGKPFIELQGQVIEVEGEISTLQDQIDSIVARVDTIEQRVGANEDAIASLQAQNITMQELLAANTTSIAELEAQIAVLQAENADLQAQIDTNIGDIAALQAQINTNNGLISSLQQTLNELGTDLQDQINNNEALIALLQEEIEEINEVLALKQTILSGSCPAGSAIRQVNSDGSVVCEFDDTSGGTIGTLQIVQVLKFEEIFPLGAIHQHIDCPTGYVVLSGGPGGIRIYLERYTIHSQTQMALNLRNTNNFIAGSNTAILCGRVQ